MTCDSSHSPGTGAIGGLPRRTLSFRHRNCRNRLRRSGPVVKNAETSLFVGMPLRCTPQKTES